MEKENVFGYHLITFISPIKSWTWYFIQIWHNIKTCPHPSPRCSYTSHVSFLPLSIHSPYLRLQGPVLSLLALHPIKSNKTSIMVFKLKENWCSCWSHSLITLKQGGKRSKHSSQNLLGLAVILVGLTWLTQQRRKPSFSCSHQKQPKRRLNASACGLHQMCGITQTQNYKNKIYSFPSTQYNIPQGKSRVIWGFMWSSERLSDIYLKVKLRREWIIFTSSFSGFWSSLV